MNLVKQNVRSFLDLVRDGIGERAGDSRYATLALSEIEKTLGELIVLSEGGCSKRDSEGSTNRSAFSDQAHTDKVIAAAKSLPKDPGAFLFFQPRKGELGINVESIVKKRAKKIKHAWSVNTVKRSPPSTSSTPSASFGKVIYPDEDPSRNGPGNIFGTNFPMGVWALTFDDGPISPRTSEVLKNLSHHKMQATFFVLSQQISREDCKGISPRIMKDRPQTVYPALARLELSDKHAVESHSYYHSQSSKATSEELKCEIVVAADKLGEVVGPRPEFFRLPYGEGVSVRRVRKVIADAGMVHVYWSVDTLDWNDKDPDSIFRRTITQMKSGKGIILFHDVHAQSVIASEKVMAYLKDPANRLRAVTIPDIVRELNGVE